MTVEEKINQKVQNLNLNYDQLVKMTDDEIRRQFKDPTFVQGLKNEAIKSNDDQINQELIKSKYKVCPKCQVTIDKFEGCNKVTCRCGCIFCYICGKAITGYDHFNDSKSCSLWTYIQTAIIPERPRHNVFYLLIVFDCVFNKLYIFKISKGQIAVERLLNLMPDQKRNAINCPTCAQKNLKMHNNNHIKCWQCTTNFCFCCKKKLLA